MQILVQVKIILQVNFKEFPKNIAEVHVEKFNKTNFENINFEMEKLWKKNLIGQFCKGHELSKPLIKVFYDEYFYSSKR